MRIMSLDEDFVFGEAVVNGAGAGRLLERLNVPFTGTPSGSFLGKRVDYNVGRIGRVTDGVSRKDRFAVIAAGVLFVVVPGVARAGAFFSGGVVDEPTA
jgi:hypothetical protein